MTEDFPIVVFHNPACGTSRNTVGIIEAAGYRPSIVEYLKTGWGPSQLRGLLRDLNLTALQLLREKGTPAAELGLLDPGVEEEKILSAMVEHPILVNRPIVVTPLGTRLCRPSEVVLEILARRPSSFTKEDGEVVTGRGLHT